MTKDEFYTQIKEDILGLPGLPPHFVRKMRDIAVFKKWKFGPEEINYLFPMFLQAANNYHMAWRLKQEKKQNEKPGIQR